MARVGRLDILLSVNKLSRVVTNWTKYCDKRLARLISYIHHTCEFRLGNTAQQRRLGLFQDSDFAGDFEDSKSKSGGLLGIFGSRTFVPISWMCKKQTSVSHSSTEAELVSLDAGLRMDGISALNLWDLVIQVFHSQPNQINKARDLESQGNLSRNTTLHMENPNPTKRVNLDLKNVDRGSSNVRSSRLGAMLHVFEDNEAVIKMILKGRSPTMRHVSRTHRVALDCFFGRINVDPKIQIRYIDTKHQLADFLTKGNFTHDEWNNLLHLFNISHSSSLCCAQKYSLTNRPKPMAKRMQEQKGEERSVAKKEEEKEEEEDRIAAKSQPTAMNLTSTVSTSSSSVNHPIASKSLGDTQSFRET